MRISEWRKPATAPANFSSAAFTPNGLTLNVRLMAKNYTAILSIHGIGRHRRHANTGALLSALEAVSGSNDYDNLDTIIQVQPGIEPSRDPKLYSDVPMLELKRARRHYGKLYVGAAFRVYEVNWSPDTRTGMPLRPMLLWTAKLIGSTLRGQPSNWLLWPRLRLARLRMAADQSPTPATRHALVILASAYRNYRGTIGARYREKRGASPHLSDFIKFAQVHAKTSATALNLNAAAKTWHDTTLPCEASVRRASRLVLGSALLILCLIGLIIAMFISETNYGNFWLSAFPVMIALPILLAAAGGTRFLTSIFSDVRYWSALNENDRLHDTRSAILDRTIAMLQHLVSDPACGRVVIVSHSLGTAIAYDALRAIGLYNLARKANQIAWIPIKKVDCFITMGSPIDKFALLFETSGSQSFREELMREELRGDVTTMPFWVGDRQRIKWLNFWDAADPVSDALQIPTGAKPRGDHFEPAIIENIEVANTAFHDPAGSHTGYLKNPAVAARIYNEIFRPEQPAVGQAPDHTATRRSSAGLMRLALAGLCILLIASAGAHVARWSLPLEIGLWSGTIALIIGLLGLLVLAAWLKLKSRRKTVSL